MTTEEGNKLIAEFMGFTRKDRPIPSGGWKHWHIKPFGYFEDEQLLYHSSWDWLMPVVEKIESIGNYGYYEVDIFGNCCDIGGKIETTGITKIDAVFKAVVQLIQWYNTQPTK